MKYFEKIKLWDNEHCGKHVISLVRNINNLLKSKNIDKLYYLDIGANVGKVYDLLGEVYDIEKVWMYEASPLLFEYLENKYNNDKKVILTHVAISNNVEGQINFDETSIIQQVENGVENLNFGLSRIRNTPQSVLVKTNKISEMVKDNNEILNNVSFIKIDTENFDFYILEDLLTVINDFRIKPIIEFEVNYTASPMTENEAENILHKFEKFGYKKLTLKDCWGDGILIPE
jgi:FkbM family methyltransferase